MTEMLNSGMSPDDITNRILAGLGVAPGSQTLPLRYGPCEPEALKARMVRAVAALGEQEVRSIIEEVGKIEVACEMCNEKYQFSEEEVMAVVKA